MSDHVSVTIDDGVAVIRLDDGKANALSPDVLVALDDAFGQAERDASAIALIGREGKLSAGFDLATMMAGPDQMRGLVEQGGRFFVRMFTSPLPVVVGGTGHALAGGAILMLCGDVRIVQRGDFKIGLNEVQIGIGLPIFAAELARARLSKRHFTQATALARIYTPDGAVDAGYADELSDDAAGDAIARARELAQLPAKALSHTKHQARHAIAEHILSTMDADMENLVAPDGTYE